MNIFEELLREGHKKSYGEEHNILNLWEEWERHIEEKYEGITKNLLLAKVYSLKTNCTLEYDDATKACDYYEKVPFEYMTDEHIRAYVLDAKMCYRFESVVNILRKVLSYKKYFTMEFFCLEELSDYSMLADGIITKEEYLEYNKRCLELVEERKNVILALNPYGR